jgi:hypothetical protein
MGINGLISYSHAAMPELEPPSVFTSKNLVMFKPKFGRSIRDWIALGFKCGVKSTYRAVFTVVRQQSTANRAGPFILRCRHCIRFAASNLLDFVGDGPRKISLHRHRRTRSNAYDYGRPGKAAGSGPSKQRRDKVFVWLAELVT